MRVHDAGQSPKGKTLGLPAHLNSQEQQEAGIYFLPLELRKAAFCKWCFDKITRNSYCRSNEKDNKHFFVLPADLVAKEMRKKDEDLDYWKNRVGRAEG